MKILTNNCSSNTAQSAIATKNLHLVSDSVKQIEKRIAQNETRIKFLKKGKASGSGQSISQMMEEVQALKVENHYLKQSLEEFFLLDKLSEGMWVCNGSNLPGEIKGFEVVNNVPVVMVQFWRSKTPSKYSPGKLTVLNPEQLDYVWSGKRNETLVRKIDSFECEEEEVIKAKLKEAELDGQRAVKAGQPEGICSIYQKRIVYCQKRLAFLKNKEKKITESQEQLLLSLYGKERKEKTLKDIAIASISRDKTTQQRVNLNHETVIEYAEAMSAGDRFPPIKVIFDGNSYYLYDGFHTTEAAYSIGRTTIQAEVTEGTKRDAILASVSVNAEHGLRRSNADKRRAVTTLLEDEEWSKWSDREIARRCKVSNTMVSNLRKNLTVNFYSEITNDDKNVVSDNAKNENSQLRLNAVTYKNKHGQVSKMKVGNIRKSDKRQIKFMPNQLLQLKLSSLEDAEETLKLLNHQYCQIESPTEFGNSYCVKFLEAGSTRVVMAEDLNPVERVSITFTYSPTEYLEILSLYGNRENLERAIKNKK